ncbi:MAG: M23 family metallopeptidase [Deltaproteobacteria bacterium]|nr:M23 family metallopeptidase [Deltaproteobacteria bacterium]NND29588.1 M23 family metallopeptidase [Myxococcales bacterium]MBT8464224.1 M23 family metallopeptidase [Deltaproteobacteria bacterium]MBT8481706.1 M23 family metallopeptidase [Deltaproteobacteria bacterium]NNK44511.1 M23 family metallopeptidase [Myxococcales bacterium]
MSADPSSPKEPSGLRPLPSVKMALLPSELRARRTRRLVAGAVLGALVLGALLLWIARSVIPSTWAWMEEALGRQDAQLAADLGVGDGLLPAEPDGGVEQALSEEEAIALARSRPNARYETPFGGVPSFRGALLEAGLEPEECTAIEGALQHIVDFRRCRPEHRLIVERDENADLERFEYHPSATEFVEVTRGEDGVFRAEQIRVKVERTPIARAGSVETSIGDGLLELGLPAGFATFFVEAFEGQINFALQARKGDVFRIVVDEERVDGEFLRYGRVHALQYDGQRTGKVQAFYHEAGGKVGQFYDDTGRAMQGGWLRTPLRYDRLSSRFDPRRFHPILKRRIPHLGLDYAAATGTPVWAAADGRVTFAGRSGPNGNLVVLRHSGGFETAYAHLHRIKSGIRPGRYVKQRELIGFVGSTGRSTGPHLHFGLKKYSRPLDPLTELNGPGLRMASRDLPSYKSAMTEWKVLLAGIENVPMVVAGADEPLVEQVDEIMD